MSIADTIGLMPRKKTKAEVRDDAEDTKDRHKDFQMIRFRRGLVYRIMRIAEEHERTITRQASKVLWEYVLAEEKALGLAELTADEVRSLANKNLTEEDVAGILQSSIDNEPKHQKHRKK